MNKYYEDTLKKINELKQKKQWEDALELVNQEISSPYIPSEYIETFEKLHIEVNREVIVNRIKDKFSKMNKMEMLAHIYRDGKLDLNVLSYFLAKFVQEIEQTDLMYLNKIFLDKNIPNNDKIFALSQIKLCNLDYEFQYFNKINKQTFNLNPNSDFEFEQQPYFVNTKKLIDTLLMKEPSLITLANEILIVIYEYFFNSHPEYDEQYLATQLSQYVHTYFEPKIQPDPKFKT
jgi:hypothetical protein